MANITFSNNQDFLDVIDLDSVLKSGSVGDYHRKPKQTQTGPGTSATTTERYNISLDSITDDELRFVTRSLITPVSFQSHGTDDRVFSHVSAPSRQRNRNLPRNNEPLAQVPTFRSESAAIFNRLTDEELSVDFVTRDLSEFMDPVLLEEVISRPGSRVPRHHSNVSDTACDLPSSSAETLPTASWIKSRTKKDQEIELPESSTTTAAANLKLGGSNQPARLISKRHSLQAEVLMALRQDSDALLQRRESLLQLRKFSEGHTPPTPPRRGTFKTERTDAGYAIDLLDTLMLRRENKYVRFESEAMEKKKHAFFANECLQQRAENTQPRLERRQSHPNRPVHIYKESHARNQITELNSLNSSDRNAKPRNEPNSVTESAKNLLARVRQNRVENRLELDLSSHQQNNERSTMTIVETKKSPAQPPADRSRRYISLNHYTPSTGKTKRSSSLATVTTTKYSLPLPSLRSTAGGSNGSIPTQPTANRRWSSALPLSSTKLYKPHPLHHQQDTSDRPRQTSHYLAKKSTLDKSTDRYVALLGKSRFQKE